jgi:hypothetical protein
LAESTGLCGANGYACVQSPRPCAVLRVRGRCSARVHEVSAVVHDAPRCGKGRWAPVGRHWSLEFEGLAAGNVDRWAVGGRCFVVNGWLGVVIGQPTAISGGWAVVTGGCSAGFVEWCLVLAAWAPVQSRWTGGKGRFANI